MQAEVDYGTPELPESDRGHVTAEAAAKVDQDVHDSDWEMLSRNPSPSPDRCFPFGRIAKGFTTAKLRSKSTSEHLITESSIGFMVAVYNRGIIHALMSKQRPC